MRLVNGNRHVVIEDNGRKIAIDVADGLSADFINKIIILCRGYLLQYVYVELIFLQIYIYVIEDSIKKKSIYKHGVKKKWKDALQALKKVVKVYEEHSPDENFSYEYAATYYDHISKDLFVLRDKIAEKLKNAGFERNAGLYANVIVLYNLSQMADNTYADIISVIDNKFHVKMGSLYADFAPSVANKYMFEFLELVIGQDFQKVAPHVRTKDMAQYFDKLSKGLFDEGIMAKAAKNATECVNGTPEIQTFCDPKKFLDNN